MVMTRRASLKILSGALALTSLTRPVIAQQYPTRPVRMIVGFPEGGPVDIAARLVCPGLSEGFGQPFVVENRPGNSGNLATAELIRSAPDGHTLLVCGPVNTINTTLFPQLEFDFARDVAPVGGIASVPLIVETNPKTSLRTLSDFVDFARANPGRLQIGFAGNGTPQHIGIELFKWMASVDVRLVPYLGSAPALADLLAAKVDIMFDPAPSSIPHVQSGKLLPLAVTSPRRMDALPEVPSVGEYVKDYEAGSWFGVVAPRATPGSIITALNKEISSVLSRATVGERLAGLGATTMSKSPEAFGEFIETETRRYGQIIRAANMTLQ